MKSYSSLSLLAVLGYCLTFAHAQAGGPTAPLVWEFGDLPAALSMAEAHQEVLRGPQMSVAIPRRHARPGERWIDLLIEVHPRDLRAEFTTMEAFLYDLDTRAEQPRASMYMLPPPGWARFDARGRPADDTPGRVLLRVDLRSLGLERARLRIELGTARDRGGIFDSAQRPEARLLAVEEILLEAQGPDRPLEPGERIPVRLCLPEGLPVLESAPLVFGMPFPAGALWDADAVRLMDAAGREIPSQREITGRWAEDGAVRWLRFDALVEGSQDVYVEAAPPAESARPEPALRLSGRDAVDGSVVLDTGAATFVLGAGRSPLRAIYREGRLVASAGPRGLYVIDNRGRLATAGVQSEMRIESQGPLAASVRFEGFYETEEGEPLARHITRIEAHAGQSAVQVTHTLILTRDTNEVWFREVGWDFEVAAGTSPRALFAVSREDWQAYEAMTFDTSSIVAAYLLQADHVQFGGGTNRWVLAALAPDGREEVRTGGETMGDWAALTGAEGGLALHCREAARQHPKEFEVQAGRITLKLFSDRAGETLDFRPQALVARWDRGNLLVDRRGHVVPRGESLAQLVLETPNNAIGWSKTHQLSIQALGAQDTVETIARHGRLHSRQLYALAEPSWLYATRALGALYPRDTDRFPDAEAFIEAAFEPYFARGHERDQEYGFVDYFAGPHYRTMGQRRYSSSTYNVRWAAWLLYARSGDRRLRAWAEGTNRAWMDGHLAHWHDAATGRIRGLYTLDRPGVMTRTPYYWGWTTSFGKGDGQSSPLQFLIDYQLTGYRRAGDVLRQFGEGAKEHLIPWRDIWSRFQIFRSLNAVYTLTWDPQVRILLEQHLDRFYDPESAVAVNPDAWPHRRVLYKTPEHMPIPIMMWEQYGDQRYRHMARAWARANIYGRSYEESRLGSDPLLGRFEKGQSAYFLYRQTGQRHLTEEMLLALQRSIPGRSQSISSINWDIQGIVYGLALVAESGVDRESLAAWLAYDDAAAEGTVRLFARKGAQDTLALHTLRAAAVRPARQPHFVRSSVVRHPPQGVFHLTVHNDAEAGDYELLVSGERGYNFVFSDSRHPLVLHAEGPWQPAPLEAVRYPTLFFHVPGAAARPRIHFAGAARLITPEGESWQEGEVFSGWVELPADRPGTWGFTPVENLPVQVADIPPFFAFRDPAYFFIPELTETAEDAEEEE